MAGSVTRELDRRKRTRIEGTIAWASAPSGPHADDGHPERGGFEPGEPYLRDALAVMPFAVYLTDATGKVTFYNEAAAELAGRRPVLGSDEWCVSWRLYWPDGTPMPHSECPMAVAIRERRPVNGQEIVVERPDGQRVTVMPFPSPLFDASGSVVGAVNVLMDISKAKLSTRELEERIARRTRELEEVILKLKQSERMFRLLVEGVTDYAIFMLDPDGRVATWNAGAERIKGYKPNEIIGQHFSRFYTEEAQQQGLPDQALATAARCGRFESEGWRVRKDGGRFWALAILDAIHDETGKLIGFAKITRDLTERKAMEEKIQHMQRMEAVGQLTSGIAHDFNNMLTIIMGNVELLESLLARDDGPSRSAAIRRSVHRALDGGRRAAALTRRLLAFSRQQALAPEQINVSHFLRRVADLLDRMLGESIHIDTRISSENCLVFADPTELENALLNLAVNSRDAIVGSGTLTIESSTVETNAVASDIGEEVQGAYVLVSVSDSGSGMTPEVLTRAFEPFFTTKEVGHGTGLGLSQVYGFIRQSGGYVTISSKPGEGTTVKMYLPRLLKNKSDDAASKTEEVPEPASDTSATVLVVEDDDGVRAFSTEALRNLGYSVLEAPNASSALEMLDCRPDVSLLFTDVGLPGVMNGWQLSDEVRQRRPGLKVLVTTAYLRSTGAFTLGRDRDISVIAKPFSVADLAAKIQELLRQ